MALFNFFRTTKNRRFDYIPRYYNPEKEKLLNTLEKYSEKEKNSLRDVKMNIQAGLRMRSPGLRSFNVKHSAIVFLIIIILLLITLYLLSSYLPLLQEAFGPPL